MKNWTIFYLELDEDYTKYRESLLETIDPYKQWEIIEIKRIYEKVMNEYSQYLKTINQDELGTTFLKTLEAMVYEYAEHKQDEVYQMKNYVIGKIYKDFKRFQKLD